MTEGTTGVVTLREPVEADSDVHAAHPPSVEIVRMYGGDVRRLPEPSLSRPREWLSWLRDHPSARIVESDGTPVGHVRLHSHEPANRKVRLAVGLFSEARLGRGIGRRAIRMTLDHAFEHAFGAMGLHRVELRVLAYNLRAIRRHRACGFVHEGTERASAWVGGEWRDDWIMGIPSHEHGMARIGAQQDGRPT